MILIVTQFAKWIISVWKISIFRRLFFSADRITYAHVRVFNQCFYRKWQIMCWFIQRALDSNRICLFVWSKPNLNPCVSLKPLKLWDSKHIPQKWAFVIWFHDLWIWFCSHLVVCWRCGFAYAFIMSIIFHVINASHII